MTTTELLADLDLRGIKLRCDGDELVIDAPNAAIDDALLQHLRALKPALLDWCRRRDGGARKVSAAERATIAARLGVDAASIDAIYPVSPLQEGLLLEHRLGGAGDPYLVRMQLAFASRSVLDRFLVAFDAVLGRHDALRSAFDWESLDEPVQVVLDQVRLPVVERAVAPGENAADVLRAQADPHTRRLDLRRAPLFEASIAATGDGGWRLVLLFHHIVCDHLSLDVVVAEVGAYLAGTPARLAPPVSFVRVHGPAQTGAAQERHFTALLGDVDAPAAPFGISQIGAAAGEIAVVRFGLEATLSAALRDTARAHGVNPAALFHLAFARVVAVYSGGDDVVFGTVLTGRTHGRDGAARAVGMFLNTLPLRAPCGEVAVGTALSQLQRQLGDLLAHEQTPLAFARRCSGIGPQAPLFAAVLNYRRSAMDAMADIDHAWEGITLESSEEHSTYPLTVIVDDGGDAFSCIVKGARGVDAHAIAGSLRHTLLQLTTQLTQTPERSLAAVDVLPPAQRALVLDAFNPATGLAARPTLQQRIAGHARLRPDSVALQLGETRCSYAELDARANRLAHYLRRRGLAAGDRVAVCLDRGLELIVSLLALLRAGAVYVPIDRAYPEQRIAFLLHDSAPAVLLTDQDTEAQLPAIALLRVVVLDDPATQAALAACDTTDPGVECDDDAPVYVIYTSGSTGQPKGVVNVQRGLSNLAAAQPAMFAVDTDSRVLQFASPSFDASVFEIAMALGAGATLCLGTNEALLPGGPLQHTLARQSVTHLTVPPSVLELLLPEQLSGVSTLVVAGEALAPALAARFCTGRQLFNAYGPSEASVCASSWRCDGSDTDIVPIGFPLPGTRLHILDRYGQPAPVGVIGEIHLGGAGLAAGYLQRDELTAQRFIADPLRSDGARLYRTGDLGEYRGDGAVLYRGRSDTQIKLRGFRIEPGEIEARLESIAEVCRAVVQVREDVNGHRRLVAYVGLAEDADTDGIDARLRRVLLSHLPSHLIPAQFVSVAHWPLTASGKLDRRALARLDTIVVAAPTAPRNAIEQAIVRSWARLLGLTEAQVGIDTDFFASGGDSMLAARFVAAAALDGLQIGIRDVLDQPTVRELAPRVRAVAAASSSAQDGEAAALPLLPNVAHALAVSSADVRDCWNLFSRVELPADCCFATLRDAFGLLLQRHDALRQSYREEAGGWCGRILPYDGTLAFRVMDVGGDSAAALDAALRTAHHDMLGGASVQHGPLIQMTVLDRGAGCRAQLLWCAHHYATDAVSSEILGREFVRLYEQLERGLPPALPPVATRYRDYAGYLQRYADSAACLAHVPYWRRALDHADLGIPLDHTDGKCYPWTWNDWRSAHPVGPLLDAAAADGAPPLADLLVAAFADAYACWSGRDVLWMNLIDNGRDGPPESPDVGSAVGWFATLYPLLLEFDRHALPVQRVHMLCTQLRELPRDKSFGLLKYCCSDAAVRAELAALPEPRINFNFLGRYRTSALDAATQDSRFGALPFDVSDDAYLADAGDGESTALGENYILFVCSIRDHTLDVTWAYNTQQFDQVSIERFDAALGAQLREFAAALGVAEGGE